MEFSIALGFSYRDIKECDKGKRVLNAVIKITEKRKDSTSMKHNTRAIGTKGLILFEEQKYKEAIDWFSIALKQAEQIEYLEYIGLMNRHLGYCYRSLGEIKKADKHFTNAAGVFKIMGKEQHFQQMEFVRNITRKLGEENLEEE